MKSKQVQITLNIKVRIVQIGKVKYKKLTFISNALYHIVDVHSPKMLRISMIPIKSDTISDVITVTPDVLFGQYTRGGTRIFGFNYTFDSRQM